MSNRLVHVARNGKVLGQYPPEQLAALIDTGHFLDSDLCYSETCPEWIPMPEFLKKIDAPKYSTVHAGESKPSAGGYPRRGRRSRRNVTALLSGWIAFLLALSAVIGSGFWIASLSSEIGARSARIAELDKKLEEKEKENLKLLFVSREMAESGIVRGCIVLRNEAGKRVAMPGVPVFLFPRKVIENYIETRAGESARIPAGTNVGENEFFTTNLPSPTAATSTDASGRFEFPVSEPGEYVLFTRIGGFAQGKQTTRIWFVAFNSQDPLNTLVQISETNCVQQFVPSLMIVEGR
ncbi:MAG: hypothetical protein WC076_00370 [Terrimicrobiaceae bacterium]|nr:hypothetical protein [Terrimicrobiaceae bacterium]